MLPAIKKRVANRKTAAWLVVIGVAALPTLVAALIQRRAPEGPSLIFYGPTTYDLGSGQLGDVLTGNVVLHNRGSCPLSYGLRTGCSCLKLSSATGEIAPRDSAEITLGLRLRTEGKTESAVVFIETNDPEHPEIQCQLTARCPAALTVSPEAIDFRTVIIGSPATASIALFDGEGNRLRENADIEWLGQLPFVKVSKEIDGANLSLGVALKTDAPLDSFTDNLSITFKGRTLQIPISGRIAGRYSVIPPVLYVSRENRLDRQRECSFFVTRNDGKNIPGPVELRAPSGVTVERMGDLGKLGPRLSFRARFSPTFDCGPGAQIEVSLSDGLEKIQCISAPAD